MLLRNWSHLPCNFRLILIKFSMYQSKKFRSSFARVGALCAITALCGVSQFANANIVTNGDFETGNINGWTIAPGGSFDFVCSSGQQAGAATCISHGGTHAMTFGTGGRIDTLSQSLVTTAGASYQLSFWLANDNPGGGGTETFQAKWDSSAVLTLGPALNTFAYGLNTFTVTGTGHDTLSFAARHDPSQWFLDDVKVNVVDIVNPNAVPEPGSLAIVGLALAGLMLTTKRKNS